MSKAKEMMGDTMRILPIGAGETFEEERLICFTESNFNALITQLCEEQKEVDLSKIPTTWLDSILTGKDAVFRSDKTPEENIESVLNEVRKAIKNTPNVIGDR